MDAIPIDVLQELLGQDSIDARKRNAVKNWLLKKRRSFAWRSIDSFYSF